MMYSKSFSYHDFIMNKDTYNFFSPSNVFLKIITENVIRFNYFFVKKETNANGIERKPESIINIYFAQTSCQKH